RREADHVLNVAGPFLMIVDRIDRQPDDLSVALVELRLEPGHGAKLSGADRSEIFRVREQHAPGSTEPVVKTDLSFRGLRLEIRGGIVNRQRHDKPPNTHSMIVQTFNIGVRTRVE